MNLNTFNYKCSRVVFLYQNRNRKFLLTNQRKEMLENIRDINNELDKNVIQFCYENIKQYYNVILYSEINGKLNQLQNTKFNSGVAAGMQHRKR